MNYSDQSPDRLFGLEPRWTYEPEISAMERTIQSRYPSKATQVRFLAQCALQQDSFFQRYSQE